VDSKGQSEQLAFQIGADTSANRPGIDSIADMPKLSLTPAEQAEYDRIGQAPVGNIPMPSPALQRKLASFEKTMEAWQDKKGLNDYSHLRQITNINRLTGTMTYTDTWFSTTEKLTWDLRRVNAR
jgi:hypothetical protein